MSSKRMAVVTLDTDSLLINFYLRESPYPTQVGCAIEQKSKGVLRPHTIHSGVTSVESENLFGLHAYFAEQLRRVRDNPHSSETNLDKILASRRQREDFTYVDHDLLFKARCFSGIGDYNPATDLTSFELSFFVNTESQKNRALWLGGETRINSHIVDQFLSDIHTALATLYPDKDMGEV